jgi:ferredoxin
METLAIFKNRNYYQIMNTQKNEKLREVAIELGDCRSCKGCIDLNPDIFVWDEVLDMPFVTRAEVTEEEVQDIMNCCPEGCIVFVDNQ